MSQSFLIRLVLILLVLATLYRILPVFMGQPYLSEVFMTEDGYLMLTVARNIATGLGMSVSEGTIDTNGVQPLATYIFTLPYLITGGDKVSSLIGIHLISAAIALAAALTLRALAVRSFARQDDNPAWPWLVAGLWFTGPLLLRHTMNGLETGLYTLATLVVLVWFTRVLDKGEAARLSDRMILGALCGLAFLSRNDAVFLCIGVFGFWFLFNLANLRMGLIASFARIVPPGILSLVFAAPWLINNQILFGSIVPISGTAQSLGAHFGQNLPLLPSKLFEYHFPMLPVPTSLETNPLVIISGSALIMVILSVFAWRTWQRGGVIRYVLAAYAVQALLLSLYYGLLFGAPHFLSRYLAPIAPLMIIATASVLLDLLRWVVPAHAARLATGFGMMALLLSTALWVRPFLPGFTQGHFQVVSWIEENVPDEVWVGAVQTGTLGYWHDRTINLDGKVNPEALAELRAKGQALEYAVKSKIVYLADWNGLTGWAELPDGDFNQNFEVIVDQPEVNLAVLRRIGATQ
ncbi:hypothetical protein ACFQ3C_10415 [Seohaeicola saemankumensis]|uniref:Glycosyltransferase RgtA/B/C/D-like domain-containing protein n=1 Tax=Seohaeicola saemankumensis TaxID=481181 RepID=A0ABW3TDH9_9RHOB